MFDGGVNIHGIQCNLFDVRQECDMYTADRVIEPRWMVEPPGEWSRKLRPG